MFFFTFFIHRWIHARGRRRISANLTIDHIKCRALLAAVRRAQSAVNLFLFLFISHAYYRITVFLISSMLENYSISDFMHVTEFKCVLVD